MNEWMNEWMNECKYNDCFAFCSRRTWARPGNSAILLETGSCAIMLPTVPRYPILHCALYGDWLTRYLTIPWCIVRSTEIAQYLRRLRNLRRYWRRKKVSLILDRGSQSNLYWFIVSLHVGVSDDPCAQWCRCLARRSWWDLNPQLFGWMADAFALYTITSRYMCDDNVTFG